MSDYNTDNIEDLRAIVRECAGTAREASLYGLDMNLFIAALAKRVTVKPEPPPKKVWSVRVNTAAKCRNDRGSVTVATVDSAAPDIIRERPDLVADEWERRYRKEHECVASGSFYGSERDVAAARARLFPELDPK